MLHLGFLQAPRRDGRGADSNAAGYHRRIGVKRDGVLVDGDGGSLQAFFSLLAGHLFGENIHQHQVIVGAARNDPEAFGRKRLAECFGIGDDLLLVLAEFRLKRFKEADGLGGDHVHERAALNSREHRFVERLGKLRFAEHHAASRASQRLVGGGGNKVGVRYGTWMQPRRDEACDVRHIDHQQRAGFFGDLPESFKVDRSRIGACAGHNQLGLVLHGQAFKLVVVDGFGFLAHPVGDNVVELAGEIERMSVRQVAAVGEAHAEKRVAGLEHRHVDGLVGLGAAVRLNVAVLGVKKLLGALNGKGFGHINEFAAAVVTLAGQTLGVLVGQGRAHRFQHGFADKVF